MTATAAVRSAGRIAALRAEWEAAAAATRAADRMCNAAQMEDDEATERLRILRAERQRALDDGATVAQLRARDSQISETERRLEVSAAELRRLVRAREAASKAEDGARRQLERAQRRAKDLPRIIRDVTVYVVVRRSELEDAERVAAAIQASVAEHQAMALRLQQEFRDLTGEDLEVTVT